MKIIKLIASSFMLFSMCATTLANELDSPIQKNRDIRFFESPPNSEDIGRFLFPDAVPIRRTRSLAFTNPADQIAEEKSVGMPIHFHFGKTSIVKQSLPFLDSIGEMLVSPAYQTRILVVEGHTDASGTEQYNQRLSELRALAIKEYLVSNFEIDPFRLFPTGRGENQLFKPESPNHRFNRRVEFLPFNKP